MTGSLHPYARPGYAAALADAASQPLPVEAWGTSVLARPIPGGGLDAIGPYPMTVLAEAADLAAGFLALARAGLVSMVLVADPLRPFTQNVGSAFDLDRPFKTHHLVHPARYAPNKHHRAELRRSLARCVVERVSLAATLPVWARLYRGLVDRHGIAGVSAFSPVYFEHLAAMPELVALAARVEGEIVAMGLWFAHEGVAYNHLGASSQAGYAVGAGYALYDAAIAHFADCRVINLGGGAGAEDDQTDGLALFKRGFADGSVEARLYGKVLDPARYAERSGGLKTAYFPAYRNPAAGLHRRSTAPAILSMSAAS